MKIHGVLLSGVGIGTIAGLLVTAWKRKDRALVSNHVSSNRVNESREEHRDQAENRFTSTLVDFSKRLSALQEQHERSAASIDEGQRLIVTELRRLRILGIWTLIFSCFGVVAFTIVLFLAYVKY